MWTSRASAQRQFTLSFDTCHKMAITMLEVPKADLKRLSLTFKERHFLLTPRISKPFCLKCKARRASRRYFIFLVDFSASSLFCASHCCQEFCAAIQELLGKIVTRLEQSVTDHCQYFSVGSCVGSRESLFIFQIKKLPMVSKQSSHMNVG